MAFSSCCPHPTYQITHSPSKFVNEVGIKAKAISSAILHSQRRTTRVEYLQPAATPTRTYFQEVPVRSTVTVLLFMSPSVCPDRSITVIFKNHTKEALLLAYASLDHGVWPKDRRPPYIISAAESDSPASVSWECESELQGPGVGLAGCGGMAVYTMEDRKTKVSMWFKNPHTRDGLESDKYCVRFEGPRRGAYKGDWVSGSGEDAVVIFKLETV